MEVGQPQDTRAMSGPQKEVVSILTKLGVRMRLTRGYKSFKQLFRRKAKFDIFAQARAKEESERSLIDSSQLRRDRDWSKISGMVVGSEI